jgi:hypothetical protein
MDHHSPLYRLREQSMNEDTEHKSDPQLRRTARGGTGPAAGRVALSLGLYRTFSIGFRNRLLPSAADCGANGTQEGTADLKTPEMHAIRKEKANTP